jgi:hypothetical protein
MESRSTLLIRSRQMYRVRLNQQSQQGQQGQQG